MRSTERIQQLEEKIQRLEERLERLEAEKGTQPKEDGKAGNGAKRARKAPAAK